MPTFHLVRHAQGFHNLSTENQQLPDPHLTDHGRAQCSDLNKSFPYHEKITHIVASPMRRTLYTALLSFAPAVEAGKKVIALPLIQEVSILPCDIGSNREVLSAEFDEQAVDLSNVGSDWNHKGHGSPWAPEMDKLEARAGAARRWLRDLVKEASPDAHVVVVTHGGFLHFLTEDWDGIDQNRGTGWENTEYRSYEFVDPEGDDANASLQETNISWRKRRGSAIGLTETEKRELRSVEQAKMQQEFDDVAMAAASAKGEPNGSAR